MSFAAVATIRGDVDVAVHSVRRMVEQGAHSVWVATGDRAAYDALMYLDVGVRLFDASDEPYHEQCTWTEQLAANAAAQGARWILPFDADEFWFSTGGGTLADVFASVPSDVGKLTAPVWHYNDWDRKVISGAPNYWGCKAAYRWSPDAEVVPGNHDAHVSGAVLWDRLVIKHLPWRSFEQFSERIADRMARLRPEGRSRGEGVQYAWLEHSTPEEVRAYWDEIQALPTVHDPILT